MSGEYLASDGFRTGGSILRNLDDGYKGGRFSLHSIYDKGEDDTFVVSAGSAVVDGGFPPTPLVRGSACAATPRPGLRSFWEPGHTESPKTTASN